jgi:hypothetical protein
MGILRFVIWTSLCIAFGIFLGTHKLGSKTPWELMQTAWKQQAPQIEKVKGDAEDMVAGVKKKVSTQDVGAAQGPNEKHDEDDRKAIDSIISKRSKG